MRCITVNFCCNRFVGGKFSRFLSSITLFCCGNSLFHRTCLRWNIREPRVAILEFETSEEIILVGSVSYFVVSPLIPSANLVLVFLNFEKFVSETFSCYTLRWNSIYVNLSRRDNWFIIHRIETQVSFNPKSGSIIWIE